MLTSRDSCSMMLVMSRVRRKTRLAALLTSRAGPSPLALTTVFSGTREVSIVAVADMARIVAKPDGLLTLQEPSRRTDAATGPLLAAAPMVNSDQLSG